MTSPETETSPEAEIKTKTKTRSDHSKKWCGQRDQYDHHHSTSTRLKQAGVQATYDESLADSNSSVASPHTELRVSPYCGLVLVVSQMGCGQRGVADSGAGSRRLLSRSAVQSRGGQWVLSAGRSAVAV